MVEPTYDLRLYNSATGKCDLSKEEARKREAYRQAESEAADRQRHERLERWRNTPLDPEAKQALGNVPPAAAWLELQDQVAGAFVKPSISGIYVTIHVTMKSGCSENGWK